MSVDQANFMTSVFGIEIGAFFRLARTQSVWAAVRKIMPRRPALLWVLASSVRRNCYRGSSLPASRSGSERICPTP